jgi:3D (Asp-Asp-Asp) domain-containing protein
MQRLGIRLLSAAFLALCAGLLAANATRTLVVTATAYNSSPQQTNSEPWIGAWGDRLEPGMNVIAVSRDLLDEGLTRGVEVEIEGFPDTYRVLDKMGRRWTRRIDIYMGEDIAAARQWGVREVRIHW